MGAHARGRAHAALAFLKQLAEFAVARGCFSSPDSRAPLDLSLPQCRSRYCTLDAALAASPVALSTWLHVRLAFNRVEQSSRCSLFRDLGSLI